MKIVMLVLGVMVAQVAVALFIARWIRAGKGPPIEETVIDPNELPETVSGALPAHAAIDNYADLAALLIALDPQPERAAAAEERVEVVPSALRPANQLGPWPGARRR
jgi:hypothetical protein